jgi:predicted MFS family arabinose efflux permease
MYAAKNVVGTGTPLLTPALINRLGIHNTLRVWGAITLASGMLAIPLIHSRIGLSTRERFHARRRTPWKFLTHSTFYVFHLANIVFSSGYGLPQTYLPSYARQVLHLPAAEATLTLVPFNFPGIFSCILFGMLGDGFPLFGNYTLTPFTITFVSAFASALSAFLLWGMAARSGVIGLAFFSVIYGFFASAYSSTWGGVLREIEREAAAHNEPVDTGVVYGLLNGGRGIGFVDGGFAGIELLKSSGPKNANSWGYGTEYGPIIVYTGVSAVIGGLSLLWRLHLRH